MDRLYALNDGLKGVSPHRFYVPHEGHPALAGIDRAFAALQAGYPHCDFAELADIEFVVTDEPNGYTVVFHLTPDLRFSNCPVWSPVSLTGDAPAKLGLFPDEPTPR